MDRLQDRSTFQILLTMAGRPGLRILHLRGFPILQQLHLEELLLRTTHHNWCILNDGTHPTSIVMGISGRPELLLDVKAVVRDQIPVIKRFSGGGTVIVDQGTVFATFIISRDAEPGLQLYPRPIMEWTERIYSPVFRDVPEFHLLEHDYVIGQMKFGGNAQAIIKDRWLHHTSFLWDYEATRMSYLKFPDRSPEYRQARQHTDFICRLKDHLPSRDLFLQSIKQALQQKFEVQLCDLTDIDEGSTKEYIRSTKQLSFDELDDTQAAVV